VAADAGGTATSLRSVKGSIAMDDRRHTVRREEAWTYCVGNAFGHEGSWQWEEFLLREKIFAGGLDEFFCTMAVVCQARGLAEATNGKRLWETAGNQAAKGC
jgi:hypothetical protein